MSMAIDCGTTDLDLTSDHPFWQLKNGLIESWPPIGDDVVCDVVIVGAGITGSMLAERLSRDGHAVVLVDRRDVCTGSTSASTALLQYEIDVSLVSMTKLIGRAAAERAYRLSHQSVDDLVHLVNWTGIECDFERKTSIYLADDRKTARLLADESRARRAIGLDVTYHDRKAVGDEFGLKGVAALSSRQAASCDPYRLAHGLLRSAAAQGGQIFDRTEISQFNCFGDHICLNTTRGPSITARHAVIACGYESQQMLKEKVVNLDNTYAIISQPLESVDPWNRDWMLWQAKNPYLYLRITADNRLLVGGEDDLFHSPSKRDASISAKAETIEDKARSLIPGMEWETEFAWAGTFGKTADGLAYIGETDEYPGCLFTLGFGGNGITFSSIATSLISKRLRGIVDSDAELFRFGR